VVEPANGKYLIISVYCYLFYSNLCVLLYELHYKYNIDVQYGTDDLKWSQRTEVKKL